MNIRLITSAIVISTCLTSVAYANVQDDINTCKDEVATIMQQDRESRATSTAVRVGTSLLGSLIGHGNAEVAVGQAVRSGGYAVSSGVQTDTMRQKMYMDQCMRRMQTERR